MALIYPNAVDKQQALNNAIRRIADFPKPGILFYDLTGILIEPAVFCYCIDKMKELAKGLGFDAIAGIEARGFVFAAPLAKELGLPLILLRKKGKLPGKTIGRSFSLEYGTDEIHVIAEDVKKDWRILLVDDLIATGGTIRAAIDLLLEAGSSGISVFSVVGLPFLEYERVLAGIPVTTLINYDSE